MEQVLHEKRARREQSGMWGNGDDGGGDNDYGDDDDVVSVESINVLSTFAHRFTFNVNSNGYKLKVAAYCLVKR